MALNFLFDVNNLFFELFRHTHAGSLKFARMSRLQLLYATYNLLCKFPEKNQVLPFFYLPDMYEFHSYTGDTIWKMISGIINLIMYFVW